MKPSSLSLIDLIIKWNEGNQRLSLHPSEQQLCVSVHPKRGMRCKEEGKETFVGMASLLKCRQTVGKKGNVNSGNEASLYTASGKEKVTHSSCLGPSQERRNAPLCGLWPSRTTQWWALCGPACGLKALLSSQVVCALLRSLTSLTPLWCTRFNPGE